MMRQVVVGVVADAIGMCAKTHTELRSSRGRVAAYEWHELWAAPASAYRVSQPKRVRLDIRHVVPAGEVCALADDPGGRLWACGVVGYGMVLPPGPLWFSPAVCAHEVDGPKLADIELEALAVTPIPASVSLPPVRVVDPDASTSSLPRFQRELVERAGRYQRGDALRIENRNTAITFSSPAAIGRPAVSRSTVPAGRLAPIEYSAPVGRVMSVGGRPVRSL